jgi:HEPN domain-containing protein
MPPDDAIRLADVSSWLRKAGDDLRCAEIDLAADPPAVEDALFHCQQAVEKSLKAFLTWHDRPFRKTHDLSEIGRECTAVDPTLEDLCRSASGLTYYATAFRYPGDVEVIPRTEADDALALARSVRLEVRSRLPATGKS